MGKEWDVLVLDLDGTLLCGQGEVSHSNLHALDMVRDLGTEVVVAVVVFLSANTFSSG